MDKSVIYIRSQKANMIYQYFLSNWNRFFKFSLVGVATLVLNWTTFNVLNKFFGIYFSISVAYGITVSCHYALNRSIAFSSSASHITSVPKYLVMVIINYVFAVIITFIYHDIFGFRAVYLIFVTSLATAISSFIIMNHFVFKKVS